MIERQDHVVYGLWIGLVVAALTIGIDQQIGPVKYMLQLAGRSPDWTSVVVACAAYFVFRLVRPFPFLRPESQAPADGMYWTGTFLVTLACGASTLFLATAVFHFDMLAHYHVAGPILCLAMLVGFLLVEASIVRASAGSSPTPVYVDGGLISALLIVPACVLWLMGSYASALPGSGLGRLAGLAYASGFYRWGLPASLGIGVFVLWWATAGVRRRLRQSAMYRSTVAALWIFGIVAYAMAMPFHVVADPGGLESLTLLWYGRPALFLFIVICLWAAFAGAIYAVQRKGATP